MSTTLPRAPKTQRDQILSHLLSTSPNTGEYSGITAYEALALYRIPRLAARIQELRERGYKIISERRMDRTGRRYVRYWISST